MTLAPVEDSNLVDDETRRDGTAAIRAAYEAAIVLVAPRVLARIHALTAAAGSGDNDHLITDAEWSKIAQDNVDDVLGDSILDGVIAGATQFAKLANPTTLLKAFLKAADGFASFVGQLRSNLDTWITNAVGQGITGDWGIGQVLDALRKGSPLSPDKADVVIDTSLQAANNAGLYTALNQAGVAAIRWVTMRDERVRPAHADADTDTIPLGEQFSIDGYAAKFPGDPDLPFRLRVNCRCTLAYVDGTQARRVIGSTKAELRAKAASLSISGRSTMNKGQLQHAVLAELCLQGMAGGPDCPDLFDQMNRTALLTVARGEGISGRYRMSREQLVYELRQSVGGGDIAQTAKGYATSAEFAKSRNLASFKRGRAAVGEFSTGSVPSPEARRRSRDAVFAEFGGEAAGSVPCVHCGLRLSDDPHSGLALLVPEPIIPWSEGGTLALSNLVPSCPSCFRALGGRGLVSAGWLEIPETIDGFTADDNPPDGLFEELWSHMLEPLAEFTHDGAIKAWQTRQRNKADLSKPDLSKPVDSVDTAAVATLLNNKIKAAGTYGSRLADEVDPGQVSWEIDDMIDLADDPMFQEDPGVKFAQAALGSPEVIASHVEGSGVAGVLGATWLTGQEFQPDALLVDFLGTTGIADGAGSQLAAEAMRRAAAEGQGVVLEPIEASLPFWRKLGMVSDPDGVGSYYYGMTADNVARVVKDLK